MTELIPVCAYARHSARGQEHSVDQQIAEFRKYAAANGMRLIEPVFEDRAKSGRQDAGRAGLEQMMAFIATKPRPCKVVLLWSSSRLARNVDDAAWYKADIRRKGYKIVYVSEVQLNIDNPVMRHVFEAVTESSDHSYSIRLAQDVKRGLLSVAGQGQSISPPPRGYKVVGRKWEVDPEYEIRVRQAWEMRSAGFTLSDIHEATDLYHTPQGYVNMFHNRAYLGTLVFSGNEFPNFCPPLCSIQEWERVQVVNSYALEHPRRARSSYLLSGRVYCAICGLAMVGHTCHAKTVYRYYTCHHTSFYPDRCGKSRVRAEALESAAVELALAEFTPEKIGPVYAAWKAEHGQEAGLRSSERAKVVRKLSECKSALANLMQAVEQGAYSTAISLQISTREQELQELEKKLDTLPRDTPATDIDIPKLCQDMARMLVSDNTAEKRLALRAIVERVDVDGRAVTVKIRRLPF